MLDFNTENTGARVVINPAPFKKVTTLKKVLLQEIKNNVIGLKVAEGNGAILGRQLEFSGCIDFLKNVIVGADISEDVENAIFECLKHCTYDMHKITPELFDNIQEAREDYYEIIISCIEENLKPFIKSLVSKWKTLAPKLGENQALSVLFAQMIN